MNAFDFHHEVEAEEKAKKEKEAKIAAVRKAEAIESALIGSKQVGSGMDNMITFGAMHAAAAIEAAKKGKGERLTIDSEFADQQVDHQSVIMEGHTDSTTITVGGVTATATVDGNHKGGVDMRVKAIDKELAYEKKWGKKMKTYRPNEEAEDPKIKLIALAALKRKAREERREERQKRREHGAKMLEETGVDDGKGAQKLLTGYVDEVLSMVNAKDPLTIPAHVTEKDQFKYSSFIQKLYRPELKDIPLVSQLVTQKALKPIHTDADKKQFNDICARLKRNDGGLVRLQLNKSGVDDRVAHQMAFALEKNIYLQMLMLHDNRVSDLGTEELATALRWHPSVHTLWLGGNPVGDRGAEALAKLAHLNHNLKDLNLSNKRPPKTWSGEAAEAESTHLSVTFQGAQALARSLMMSCQLTSLNLADQRIKDKGARVLFAALPPSFLRTLNLKNNRLTSKCCAELREVLVTTHLEIITGNTRVGTAESDLNRPNTGVRMLTEGHNPGSRGGQRVVTPAGVVRHGSAADPFAQSTRVKPLCLELLNLSDNNIDCDGAAEIAYALCYNKTLKVLHLAKNKIDDRGIGELLSSLQYNQVIRSIVTLYNTSKDERVDRVLELRTAAVQALEDHLDRAQNREDFHETGFLVDRSGTAGQKQKGKRGAGGGSGSQPGSPDGKGMPLPGFSKAQLADFSGPNGMLGVDSGIGGPVGSAAPTPAGSVPGTPLGGGGGSTPGGTTGGGNAMLALIPGANDAPEKVTRTPGFNDETMVALNTLAAGARKLNRDPGVGAQGAPQQPIDFSQIAMPAHVVEVARSGSANREQSFDKRVRKELIPVKKRKVPTVKGGSAGGPGSAGGSGTGGLGGGSAPGTPMAISQMGSEFGFMGGGAFPGDTAESVLPPVLGHGGDARLALSNEERDILSPLPSSRTRGRPSGLRGTNIGRAGMSSPTRPFLLQAAAAEGDAERLSALSDIYDSSRKTGSYTHLNVLKRASTAPSDGSRGANGGGGASDGGGFGAKGWGVAMTSIGLGDATDRAHRDDEKYSMSAFTTSSHGGKVARPDASAGGFNSGSGASSKKVAGSPAPAPARPSTTGSTRGGGGGEGGGGAPAAGIPPLSPALSASGAGIDSPAAVSSSFVVSAAAFAAGRIDGDFDSVTSGIAITPIKQQQQQSALSLAMPLDLVTPPSSPPMPRSRSGSPGRSMSPGRSNRLPPSRGQPLPHVLTEARDEAKDEEDNSSNEGDSRVEWEDDNNGWEQQQQQLLLHPLGTPISPTTAEGKGGNLAGFLDMFEGPEEQRKRLEWEEKQREIAEHERKQEEERIKQEREKELAAAEAKRKRKKKKGKTPPGSPNPGSRTGSRSGSRATTPLASPNPSGGRKRRDTGNTGTADSSGPDSGSEGGTPIATTPMSSPPPSRGSGIISKGVIRTDTTGSSLEGTPLSSPDPSGGRKRLPSNTDSVDSGGDSATGSPNASPMASPQPSRGRKTIATPPSSAGALRRSVSFSSEHGGASPSPSSRNAATSNDTTDERGDVNSNEQQVIERRLTMGNKRPTDAKTEGPISTRTDTERLKAREEMVKYEAGAPKLSEKQRLGASLPGNPYRRYFSREGKPVYNTDLAKTRGVPKIPSTGIRPIRSASGGYRDSGQHIGYLGIVTPDDPAGARPLSLVEIAKQQQEYRAAIVADRQTETYKELKKDAMDQQPRGKQRAAAIPVPEKFWSSWRRDNRLRYPNGIDRARGTSSTNITDLRTLLKNKDGSIIMNEDARTRLKIKTPGEALAYRRKKRAEEIEREKRIFFNPNAVSIGKAKKLTHDMLGLRSNQTITDLNKPSQGLTKRLETEKPKTPMGPKNKFTKPNL
jgi:hypothetical protein